MIFFFTHTQKTKSLELQLFSREEKNFVLKTLELLWFTIYTFGKSTDLHKSIYRMKSCLSSLLTYDQAIFFNLYDLNFVLYGMISDYLHSRQILCLIWNILYEALVAFYLTDNQHSRIISCHYHSYYFLLNAWYTDREVTMKPAKSLKRIPDTERKAKKKKKSGTVALDQNHSHIFIMFWCSSWQNWKLGHLPLSCKATLWCLSG